MRPYPLLVLVLAATVPAQTSAVVDALGAGDVGRALDLLDAGTTPADDELRLQAIRGLAAVPPSDAKLHDRALRWAAQLLPAKVPAALAETHKALAADVGRELVRLLIAQKDVLVDGRIADRTHLGAGVAAQQALRIGGLAENREMLALGLHLAPLLLAGERARDAVSIATDALAATPSTEQATALHGVMAKALLQLGRPGDALSHAQRFVGADPTNAEAVLPVVRAMPASMVADAFPMLRAVIQSRPSPNTGAAWSECLAEYYVTVERLAAKKSTAATVAELTTRMPLPQIWHQSLWGQGYRIWLDQNARPAKIASGKDALLLPVPQSNGWRRRDQPPEDLQRWQNTAYCLQRGENGPTLVVSWFGPNLEYWYGDTPVERGLTGKTVRGHSAGAIARMIFDIAYGEDAKARQQKFTVRAPLPFALGESGHRKTFALGSTIHDETVFSHGQVTIAVLLRVTEAQLAELEPELRWMYATLRKG